MKRGLSAVLAAALLAACGSDDGTDDRDDTGRTETTRSGTKLDRFESDRIPFTFSYPADLKVEVRRTARRELAPRRYLNEFRRDLEGEVRAVKTREDQIGELKVGVLEVEKNGSTSVSYFFPRAGRTWQIECLGSPDDCRSVLESVDFDR